MRWLDEEEIRPSTFRTTLAHFMGAVSAREKLPYTLSRERTHQYAKKEVAVIGEAVIGSVGQGAPLFAGGGRAPESGDEFVAEGKKNWRLCDEARRGDHGWE